MGEVSGVQNLICCSMQQPLIGQDLLFFCYIALEKYICSDAADTEYIARKTTVQRIMWIEHKN